MKKKLLASLLTVAMLLTLLPVSALAIDPEPTQTWADAVQSPPEGYAEVGKTITISSAEGLAWFAKQINTWESQSSDNKVNFAGYTINITEDINLSGKLWTPIDTATVITDTEYPGYKVDRAGDYKNKLLEGAVINGNGHTIIGMTVHNTVRGPIPGAEVSGGQSCYYYAGFIGRTNDTLTIQNLAFDQAVVDGNNEPTINKTGGSSIAVVAGINGGNLTLQNVTVSNSTVSGYTKIAGFVGQQAGTLKVVDSAVTGCTFNVLPCQNDPEGGMGSPTIGISTTENLSYQGVTVSGNTCVDQSTWVEKKTAEDGTVSGKSSNGSWYVIWAPFSIFDSDTSISPAASIDAASYLSLADAISAAQPGDTVTLLKDVALSAPIAIEKELILDLSEHTISVTKQHGFDVINGGNFSLVGTGTINATGSGVRAFQVKGNTNSSTWADTTEKTVLTIGPDVTVNVESELCVWIAGKGAVLNVHGSLKSPGDSAIYGNGTRSATTNNGGTEINIFDRASVIAKSVAIYHPQAGTLTISGGTVEGYAAIGIKSGNLNITGGTVRGIAKDDVLDDSHSATNGIAFDGSAIVIDSYVGYAGNMNLTISGNAVVESLHSTTIHEIGNTASATNVISIDVTGGTLKSLVGKANILVRDVTKDSVTITGGTFTAKPDNDYLGTGLIFTAKDEDNGLWTVAPAQGMSADASAVNGTASAEVGGTFVPPTSGTNNGENVSTENKTIQVNVATGTAGDDGNATVDNSVISTEVTIQGASLSSVQAAEDIDSVELTTDVGTLTISKDAWDEITENATDEDTQETAAVTLTISKAEFANFTGTDGKIPGVTITATAGGETVFSNEETSNTITVSVPLNGLTNPKVYYLGATGPELIHSEEENGNLVWDVTHFSNYAFASGYEAAVTSGTDTVFYYSLQSAITAADVGGSYVTLLKNIDLTSNTNASLITVPGNRNITINCTGEQFTITGSYTYANADDGKTIGLFTVGSGSTVTLDNVGLELTGNSQGVAADGATDIYMGTGILLSPNSTLKITNGSDVALNTLSRGLVSGTTGSQVLVDNSSLTVNGTSGNGSNGGEWTIQNGSEVQFLNNGNHGLSVESLNVSASTVDVDNAGYTGIYASEINLSNATVTVTDSARSTSIPAAYQNKGAVQLKQSGTPSLSLANGSTLTLSGNGNAEGGRQLISLGSATLAKSLDSVINGELDGGSNGYVVTVMDGSALIEQAVVTGTYTLPTAPVKDGYTFKGWLRDDGELCSARQNVSISGHTTFTAKWEANPTTPGDDDTPSQPSGGDSSNDYFIDTGYSKYGKVTAYPGWAEAGDTVKLTVKPNSGYELSELSVTSSGKSVKLTAVGENQFTFTMPSGTVSVEATFTASNTPAPVIPSTGFVDVSASAWYYNAVNYVVDEGIMSGTGANTFEPNTTLTRAMVAQMLYAMSGKPNQGSNTFGDVDSSAWYADAVAWVSYKGVMTGYGEGRFAPNTPVTREQMALILYNYAKLQGYDTDASSSLSSFADGASVSSWAQQAMSWAVAQGLFSGRDGNMLTPAGTATRAEIAQIFMQFCKNVAE